MHPDNNDQKPENPYIPSNLQTHNSSPLLFWLELSHVHLTWCSLRSLLFVLFTEVTEKQFNFLLLLLLWFGLVFLVACSISGDWYYCISKSSCPYAKQIKFLWLLSLVMYFLQLCSLLLLPVTLQLFKSLFIWALFYGLMISYQGRQLYLSPFKSAL